MRPVIASVCVREVDGELDGTLFSMTICLFMPAES